MSEAAPLHPVSRVHLEAIADATGILQHATGARSDPRHGYCTDDVARALAVDLLHGRELAWPAVEASIARAMRFLREAFDPATGRFRNFRRIDGSWLDAPGSEDAHARALLALGEAVAALPDGPLREEAAACFGQAIPAALELGYLRPRAAILLACDAALQGGLDGGTHLACRRAAAALGRSFQSAELAPDWPWPEPILTYENGLPARALIVGGRRLDRPDMVKLGLRLLDWLIDSATAPEGHLSPVGNRGWWPRGGSPARFDQQPIEATSLLQAAAAGYDATGSRRYLEAMDMAYAWFLGANDIGRPVAEPDRGACFDGLTPTGVNENQGAESTLMWLIALEEVRRRRVPAGGWAAVSAVGSRDGPIAVEAAR